MALRKKIGRIIFILILGGFIAVTLNQGKEGGELVYKYGANNEVVVELKDDIADAAEDAEDDEDSSDATEKLQNALNELQLKYDALLEKNKEVDSADEATKEETTEKDSTEKDSTETETNSSN